MKNYKLLVNKKIVLISSGQPSANPRLVKEAIALLEAGYIITVIYCPLSPWAEPFDVNLFARYPQINWVKAGHHPQKQRRLYQWARLRRKLYHVLFRIAGNRLDAAVRSFAFYSQELTSTALRHKADLYIGHNIGALASVVLAARKHGVKAAFDFEDFHRGEDTYDSIHWKKVKAIEDDYVQSLAYATAASPLIKKAYQEIYPKLALYTVNNCFPVSYAVNKCSELTVPPLKLFWFSQFVGANRGLEAIIEAIGLAGNSSIQLTLLGNYKSGRKDFFVKLAAHYGVLPGQLQFLEPVSELDIVHIASQHHIGLACEPGRDMNNEIALSNKLFMYLLAGNCVLFSNTKGHADFWQKHSQIGRLYEQGDIKQIASFLKEFYEQPERLNSYRYAALELGKKNYNWEQEQKIIIEQVNLLMGVL
jgi:hypothetical protein